MRNKKIMENIGRFVKEKEDYFYVDSTGKVWSQEMIADLIKGNKALREALKILDHYKKHL